MTRSENQGLTDLSKAAARRLGDGLALEQLAVADPKRAHCAKYIAGYAIECLLKTIALETYGCYSLQELAQKLDISDDEVFVHGLEKIARRLPSLYNRLKSCKAQWRAFARVNQWQPSWRYEAGEAGRYAAESAASFLADVQVVYNWLETNRG
jgi:hypothetical protein